MAHFYEVIREILLQFNASPLPFSFGSTFYHREFSLRNLRLILLRSQYSFIEIFNTPFPAALQKANDIIHCPLLPSNYPLAGLGSENDSTLPHPPFSWYFHYCFHPQQPPRKCSRKGSYPQLEHPAHSELPAPPPGCFHVTHN